MPKGIYFHKPLTEKHKENLSKAFSGENNPFYGKHHTLDSKNKIGIASKGRIAWSKGKHPEYLQGKNHPMFGTHHVAWNKGIKFIQITGENHPRWKGGFSKKSEYANRYLKQWRNENPLKVKLSNHKRRLLNSGLTISIIQQTYEDNIKQYGTLTCYLCLEKIQFGKDHLEHKTPLSRGGTNQRDNLDIACQKCNCKKNTKTEIEYKKEILQT